MTVRRATAADGKGLLALSRSFATSFEVQEETFWLTLPQVLDDPEACLLIAETNTPVAYLLGFVHSTFYANGGVGWVEELMVDEGHRRQGVGSQLMRAFENWVEGRQGRLVALATRRAAEFYRATGYEQTATYFRKVLARK